MSRIIAVLLVFFFFISCNQNKNNNSQLISTTKGEVSLYGNFVSKMDPQSVAFLFDQIDDTVDVKGKFEIEITEVCQNKGCWMKAKLPDGSNMHITFKDYSFFVPKTSANNRAIIEGIASFETTTVEELQHYAKDAGKTQEEIDLITEPKNEIKFIANGVQIFN